MGLEDDVSGQNCTAAITRLLTEAGSGDPHAADKLLPLVYEQLRRLARGQMRRERRGHTLGATALVHEAYLRLVDESGMRQWDDRWHFFGAAAEAMRRILVENARRKSRAKRGGRLQRVSLDEHLPLITVNGPADELLALDEALIELERQHPRKAKLVKLRYFAGLTIEQAAQALGISTSTADRDWEYARAWLYQRVGSE